GIGSQNLPGFDLLQRWASSESGCLTNRQDLVWLRGVIAKAEVFAQQPESKELGTDDDQQYGQHQQWSAANGLVINKLFDHQPEAQQATEDTKDDSRQAEEMERSLAVLGDKNHREQV